MRNQSIIEEISDNLKKTIKKWNQMEIEEPRSNYDSVSSLRKKTNIKSEIHKNSSEKEQINAIEFSGKDKIFKNEKISKNQSQDDLNFKEDRIKSISISNNDFTKNDYQSGNNINFNKTDSFKYNPQVNNNFQYKFDNNTSLFNNKSNHSIIAQTNKILQGLDDLSDDMNKDFREVEEMIDSVERELKSILK
jgi:hypothetical protein